MVFSEATCCGCTRFAWRHLCLHNFAWYCFLWLLWWMGIWAELKGESCVWNHIYSGASMRRCREHDEAVVLMAGTMFYYSPLGIIMVASLMGCTWFFCAPCALWCLRAPSRTGGAVAPA